MEPRTTACAACGALALVTDTYCASCGGQVAAEPEPWWSAWAAPSAEVDAEPAAPPQPDFLPLDAGSAPPPNFIPLRILPARATPRQNLIRRLGQPWRPRRLRPESSPR